MRRKTWRVVLVALATGLAVTAAAAFTFSYFSRPTTLKIAVGQPKGEDVKLVSALAAQFGRERAKTRLQVIEKEDSARAAEALDRGEVDLAVVRQDLGLPHEGEAIVILRRNLVVLIARPGSKIQKVADLAGRRVGIVGRSHANDTVLDAILQQYGIDAKPVQRVPVDPDAIDDAWRQGKFDVLLVAGPVTGRTMMAAVNAASADGKRPSFIAIDQAEALAQRSPLYEAKEIVAGAFGGNPPRPAEKVESISFSHYVMAHKSLGEEPAGELTRLFLQARSTLAAENPAARQIEAPDTERNAVIPVHPGAAAYIDGDQKTFFDRYGDYLYLSVMFFGGIGSAIAGIASYTHSGERKRKLALLERLVELMRAARAARSLEELDEIEAETDDIVASTMHEVEQNKLDDSALAAFSLGLAQARGAIAERRTSLAGQWERGQAPAREGRPGELRATGG